MATTSKTSGGKKVTDKNREAERAKARAYAAKGKSKPTAKDMPYGWALPKATGGSSGPPTRAVLHSGRTSASGGPSTRGIKGGGSSGPPTRAKLNAGRKAKPKEEPKAATPAPTPKPKEEPKAATPAATPAGRKQNSAPMLKQPSLNRTIDMSAVQGAATAATVAANKAGKPLVAAGEKVGKKAKALMARIAEAKRQGDEAKAALKAHNAKMEKELEAWKASKK